MLQKTVSKRVVQETTEVTGDLIGNKITYKITPADKSKEDDKTKEIPEIYKDNKLLKTQDCFDTI